MLPDISPAVAKKNARWYAKNYYAVEDDILAIFEKFDTSLLDEFLKPKMRVLDAMMGRGRHAIRYAVHGCIVTGNDLNPHMVTYARKAAKTLRLTSKQLKLQTGDATDLKNIKTGSFDVAIAMFSAVGTIPGSQKRQAAMNEMARAVKKNGLVIVHAHNILDGLFKRDFAAWSWRNLIRADKGLEKGDIVTDYNGMKKMFNHFYTPAQFRKSYREAGLIVVEERYYDYGTKEEVKGPFKRLRADGFIFIGKKK